MSKAVPTVPSPTEKRNDLALRDLAGELHDRIGEASALVGALNIIAATTTLDEASLGRLRHVVLVTQAAVVDAADISSELRELVRQ